ncbi:hypothetical protein BAE44_0002360 [Dichanthelium oligosanthes]|uniref:F-box domain-containing protein n=1 Tax=Dichanthelium oligosanthes TaxID=888268 RepID=A0A1E5WHJ0_9POAL|nr:hypothetical protein BAE44_0002360 [Dichanthelium oligosanthes]
MQEGPLASAPAWKDGRRGIGAENDEVSVPRREGCAEGGMRDLLQRECGRDAFVFSPCQRLAHKRIGRPLRYGGSAAETPSRQLAAGSARRPHWPIPEILLRVPPHELWHLVRCSAVCRPWRRLLTDPAFLRRYREFHGALPMLGFLFDLELIPQKRCVARFVRITSFRPRALDHGGCYVRDARHGRVLFSNFTYEEREHDLFVWNPITDERWGLPLPVIRARSGT